MTEKNTHFNNFVEKIVIHNKLILEKEISPFREYCHRHPESSLLHGLVQAEFLKQKHADLILKKYHDKYPIQNETPSIKGFHGSSDFESNQTIADKETKTASNVDLTLKSLLEEARKVGASDLHILPDSSPIIRKNGRLESLHSDLISSNWTEKSICSLLNPEQQKELEEKKALDCCLNIHDMRYRCCFIKQSNGWDGSFRIIRNTIPTFKELNLPSQLQRMTEFHQGLVLVTGPSGMGKSTTIAAMVDHINQTRNEHIITLEDPIEYIFEPKKSHISQREVGSHTDSFSAALRAALREDPDVIVVGELRDIETASLAISAAETGHLVFTTLHTNSASQTIIRLLDFFPPKQQAQITAMISESIQGIVCQQLIPNKSGDGRELALEIMFNNAAIGNLIREEKLYQLPNMIRLNHKVGMKLIDESIEILLREDRIDPKEAYSAVYEQKLFQNQGETQRQAHGQN